jgi:hypothetical protein
MRGQAQSEQIEPASPPKAGIERTFEERGEPLFPPFPCDFPYAFQRL